MARNRGLDPSRTLCPQCATDIIPTPLGIAYHRVRHLEWMRTDTASKRAPRSEFESVTQLRDAWRQYSSELEATVSHLNGVVGDERDRVNERDEVIAGLEADYEHVLAELQALRTQLERAS